LAQLEESHNKNSMDTLNPYMMPSYYWYEPMDLPQGMQMMNTVGWQPEYDTYEDVTYDDTGLTKLNPTAPDFQPGHMNTSDQKTWNYDNQQPVVQRKSHFEQFSHVGNEQLEMPAVPMDIVFGANYLFNDFFGFCAPEVPMLKMPYFEANKKVNNPKKTNSTKLNKPSSSSYKGVTLVKPEISYGKEELMAIAKSPLCQVTPQTWPMISKRLPRLVKREGPTANILIKEVRAIKKQEEEQNSIKEVRAIKKQEELQNNIKEVRAVKKEEEKLNDIKDVRDIKKQEDTINIPKKIMSFKTQEVELIIIKEIGALKIQDEDQNNNNIRQSKTG